MSPEKAFETMMSWFPVIVIGVFLAGYVVTMIRDMWKGDE
jgi:hypothetical protein